MQLVNAKSTSIRKCAFCKNWYDPTNSAIRPRDVRAGFWEFDEKVKRQCLRKSAETPAFYCCHYYEGKL